MLSERINCCIYLDMLCSWDAGKGWCGFAGAVGYRCPGVSGQSRGPGRADPRPALLGPGDSVSGVSPLPGGSRRWNQASGINRGP